MAKFSKIKESSKWRNLATTDYRGRCKKTKLVVMERYLWLYLFLQHVMMATNKMHRKIPTEQVCVNPASRLRAR